MSEPQSKPKITLYWLEDSKAHRILWLLEELGLEYDLKMYKRVNGLAPLELKKINGLGKAPIIAIQDPPTSEPIILFESALITEYLIDHYGPHLKPPPSDTAATLQYKFYLYYAEGGVFQPLLVHFIMQKVHTSSPFFVKPITSGVLSSLRSGWLNRAYDDHFGFVEAELGKGDVPGRFLCGEHFSGPDMLHSFNWEMAGQLGVLDEKKYPRLSEYWERLKGREAYKRAQDKVRLGGFKAAL